MTTIEQEVALLVMHWKECDSFTGCTVAITSFSDDETTYSITMSTPYLAKDAIEVAKQCGYYVDSVSSADEEAIEVTFFKDKLVPYKHSDETEEQWVLRQAAYQKVLSEVQQEKKISFFVGEP